MKRPRRTLAIDGGAGAAKSLKLQGKLLSAGGADEADAKVRLSGRREKSEAPALLPSVRNPDFPGIIERVASAADLGSRHMPHAAPRMGLQARSPTTATTRAQSRRTSATATFRIRRAIPRWRRSGSRSSFEIDPRTKRRKGSSPNAAL